MLAKKCARLLTAGARYGKARAALEQTQALSNTY